MRCKYFASGRTLLKGNFKDLMLWFPAFHAENVSPITATALWKIVRKKNKLQVMKRGKKLMQIMCTSLKKNLTVNDQTSSLGLFELSSLFMQNTWTLLYYNSALKQFVSGLNQLTHTKLRETILFFNNSWGNTDQALIKPTYLGR